MQVLVNFVLREVNDLDDASETFTCDFYLSLWFQDPRARNLIAAGSTSTQLDSALQVFQTLNPEMTNGISVSKMYDTVYTAYRSNATEVEELLQAFENVPVDPTWDWIELDTRYRGSFRSYLRLEDFPFDTQVINVSLEETRLDASRLVFRDRIVVKPGSRITTPTGFALESRTDDVVLFAYPQFRTNFSRYRYIMEIKRDSGILYGVRIITTLLITTVLTFYLFTLQVGEDARQNGAATFFLAAVAYMFVITDDLPKIPYTTRLDNFILISLLNNLLCFVWFSLSRWIVKSSEEYGNHRYHRKITRRIRRIDTCTVFVAFIVYGSFSVAALSHSLSYLVFLIAYPAVIALLGIVFVISWSRLAHLEKDQRSPSPSTTPEKANDVLAEGEQRTQHGTTPQPTPSSVPYGAEESAKMETPRHRRLTVAQRQDCSSSSETSGTLDAPPPATTTDVPLPPTTRPPVSAAKSQTPSYPGPVDDWVQAGNDVFYSKFQNIGYHPATGHFWNPRDNRWFNPNSGTWYEI